jgi:hypothetical protein
MMQPCQVQHVDVKQMMLGHEMEYCDIMQRNQSERQYNEMLRVPSRCTSKSSFNTATC